LILLLLLIKSRYKIIHQIMYKMKKKSKKKNKSLTLMWLYSAACSNEHAINLCTFQFSMFQCLLFWMLLQRNVESDSTEFLVCISCLTVLSSCYADVRLMLWMQFLILLQLSTFVSLLWRLSLMWRLLND